MYTLQWVIFITIILKMSEQTYNLEGFPQREKEDFFQRDFIERTLPTADLSSQNLVL